MSAGAREKKGERSEAKSSERESFSRFPFSLLSLFLSSTSHLFSPNSPNKQTSYTSNVILTPPSSVLTTASGSALFRHLDCRWRFSEGPLPTKTTWVSFSVSFEFRSAVHRHLAGVFFDDVVRKMVEAFEGRCAELYGAPSVVGRRMQRKVVEASPLSLSSSAAAEAAR